MVRWLPCDFFFGLREELRLFKTLSCYGYDDGWHQVGNPSNNSKKFDVGLLSVIRAFFSVLPLFLGLCRINTSKKFSRRVLLFGYGIDASADTTVWGNRTGHPGFSSPSESDSLLS